MAQTQLPCRTHSLAIVVHEEAQWGAAHLQAALLEGAELEQTSNEERHRSDKPGMKCQPWSQGHQAMHQRISDKGPSGKGRPDHSIASQKREGDSSRTLLPTTRIH